MGKATDNGIKTLLTCREKMDKKENKAIVPMLCWITAGLLAVWVLWLYLADAGPVELTMAPLNGAALAIAGDAALDLNAATEAELEELPGIGPVLAQRIVQWREENGAFGLPEDIMDVPGVGQAKYEAIAPYITC